MEVKRLDLMRRRIEVVRSAVDLGREVTYGTPKTHQHRSVPLPRSLVDALAEQIAGKEPDELGFTAPRGGPLRNHNFRARFLGPAAAAVGIPHLTRTTCGTPLRAWPCSPVPTSRPCNGCSATRPRR